MEHLDPPPVSYDGGLEPLESWNVLRVPSADVNSTTGYATRLSLVRFLRNELLRSVRHSTDTTVPHSGPASRWRSQGARHGR